MRASPALSLRVLVRVCTRALLSPLSPPPPLPVLHEQPVAACGHCPSLVSPLYSHRTPVFYHSTLGLSPQSTLSLPPSYLGVSPHSSAALGALPSPPPRSQHRARSCLSLHNPITPLCLHLRSRPSLSGWDKPSIPRLLEAAELSVHSPWPLGSICWLLQAMGMVSVQVWLPQRGRPALDRAASRPHAATHAAVCTAALSGNNGKFWGHTAPLNTPCAEA